MSARLLREAVDEKAVAAQRSRVCGQRYPDVFLTLWPRRHGPGRLLGMVPDGWWLWLSVIILMLVPVGGLVWDRLRQRANARDAARDRRCDTLDFYIAVDAAAGRLEWLSVWPANSEDSEDPRAVQRDLSDAALALALRGSTRVDAAQRAVRAAAEDLATVVAEIRRASKPGHGGAIDDRYQARYDSAVAELGTARTAFVDAARVDMGVDA